MTVIYRSNTTTTAAAELQPNHTGRQQHPTKTKTKVPNIKPLQVPAYLPQPLHELRPLLIVQRPQLLALLLFTLQDRLDLGGLLAQL